MFFIKKVLILFGGNSPEHYVSCLSCKSIIEHIDKRKFRFEVAGIDFNNIWYKFKDDILYLENRNWRDGNTLKIDNVINYLKGFDVIFPVTHGSFGEDGRLQGMLELFNIKFVGCESKASMLCMDKALSKIMFDKLGINEVPYVILKENDKVSDIIDKIEFPVIVKPSNGGSSIGINKASNKKELIKAIKEAKCYDDNVIIEKFIKARELEVAVLENKNNVLCSRPGEIRSNSEFYDYDAKYISDSSYTTIPGDLPENIVNEIKEHALKIFKELGLRGYSRIDFFYDEENEKVYINEVNTLPGFTFISMYPKLIEDAGINYTDLITLLINNST